MSNLWALYLAAVISAAGAQVNTPVGPPPPPPPPWVSPATCVGGCPTSCACAKNSFCCTDWSDQCNACENGFGNQHGCKKDACAGTAEVLATCECLIDADVRGACPARTVSELESRDGIEDFWQDKEGTRRPAAGPAPGTCCQWSSTLGPNFDCEDHGELRLDLNRMNSNLCKAVS